MSTQRADLDFRPSVLKNIADGPALDGISREPARVRERMTAGGARMIRGRLEVAGPVITDYILRTSMNPSRIFLLLHGYGLAAEYVYRKLLPLLPEDAAVLAPNGPFPIPERRPDGFRLGFAWYFYDPAKDQYLIDYRVALAMLKGVLEQLGFSKLSKTLIGFSQGGYLAPFAANALGGVEQVIGVGCRFPEEDFDFKPTFRMDQVHGADDDRVDPKESRASHERLRVQGVKGSFAEIAGEGHRLSPGIVEQIGVFLAAQDSIHQSN